MNIEIFYYFFLFALSFSCFSALAEEWMHCTVLDGERKFQVCWNLIESADERDDREIEFKVEVEAHGYVGFGLSPNGGMAGSDIVTGWIKEGQVYFQDRYATDNIMPEIDEIQNWNLVSGSENDTHSVLVFRRKLDTCDNKDRKIDDSTTRLIYAYSDEDPASENSLKYHFKKRGTKSVLLLQLKRSNQAKIDKSTLKYWDVLSPNYTIPWNSSTMYWCTIYKAPELSEKNHVVLVEPLIQKGNEAFVHHLLMYECVGGDPSEYDHYIDFYGHQCHHTNMPDAMKRCEGVFLAWGVGGEDLVLPEYVGLPLVPSPTKYYMMEIHYDNPNLIEGIVDNSGFRIYYTPKLRKYDAGTLMIGSTVSSRVIVPPKQEKYIVTGHSNPKCLDPVLPEDGIKFLGVLLHSHLLGRGLKARHFRKSEELPFLGADTNYDFNYQEYRYYTEEVAFLPGDQITVECTYDSSKRDTTTFGGESTREEMCLAFILYYPLIERFASLSVPQFDVINKALRTNFTKSDLFNGNFRGEMHHYDWTAVDIKEVQKSLRYGLHDTHCYLGNGVKNSIKAPISYPKIQEYKEVSSCISKELQNGGLRLDFSFLSYLCILVVYTFAIKN